MVFGLFEVVNGHKNKVTGFWQLMSCGWFIRLHKSPTTGISTKSGTFFTEENFLSQLPGATTNNPTPKPQK